MRGCTLRIWAPRGQSNLATPLYRNALSKRVPGGASSLGNLATGAPVGGMSYQPVVLKKATMMVGRCSILTAFPPAHQFCAAVISISATCISEFIDKVDPFLDVLFELAESEETTVDHPGWTVLRVGFDTVLRSWRI